MLSLEPDSVLSAYWLYCKLHEKKKKNIYLSWAIGFDAELIGSEFLLTIFPGSLF